MLRRAGRGWQVLTVLLRWFILPALPLRRRAARSGAERTREALAELGGAWVKLGQVLSMRFDLLPADYCEELLKLLDAVPPFPYPDVRQIVNQELGGLPERLFATFQTEPFASASIGQVHRATLLTGERVAVKVQRPRIREIMRADIELMYTVSWLLDLTRFFGATQSRVLIDEFARATEDELDYLLEARQSVLLYQHARGEELEHIARVYRAYTTSRVITTELLEGIPLIAIVRAVRAGDSAYLERLRAEGYDLERIIRHIDWNMLNQVYVFGVFHADLHPANLFVLPGNAIGYVDFGMVGRLTEDARESLIRYGWLLFQGQIEAAVRELMRWFAPTSVGESSAARFELVRIHEAFLYAVGNLAEMRAAPLKAYGGSTWNPYTSLAVEIMNTVRRYHLALAADMIVYLRMLVMLGTLRHQLATEYDLPAVARRFFGKLVQQQAESWIDPRLAMGRIYEATFKLKRALQLVEFVEAQQPLLASFTDSYYGLRRRMNTLKQRAVGLGLSVLVIGGALYFTLADPGRVRSVTDSLIPFDWLHAILLGALVLLIVGFIEDLRQMTRG